MFLSSRGQNSKCLNPKTFVQSPKIGVIHEDFLYYKNN